MVRSKPELSRGLSWQCQDLLLAALHFHKMEQIVVIFICTIEILQSTGWIKMDPLHSAYIETLGCTLDTFDSTKVKLEILTEPKLIITIDLLHNETVARNKGEHVLRFFSY